MDLYTWAMVGAIVGILSTVEFERMNIQHLLLSVSIGIVGSVSGGVIGYIIHGIILEGVNITIFTTALILTILSIASWRRIKSLHQYLYMKKSVRHEIKNPRIIDPSLNPTQVIIPG